MTLPSALATGRKLLERHIAPYLQELPVRIADTLPPARPENVSLGDYLNPCFAVEETGHPTKVRLVRHAHISEGTTSTAEEVDLHALGQDEVAARYDAFIGIAVQLLRQDAAIVAAGEDVRRPGARWYTAHPFMAEAARHWGWDEDALVRPNEIVVTGQTSVMVRDDRGIMTTLLQKSDDEGDVHFMRMTYRRHLSCGHLSVMAPNGTTILAQYSDSDRPAVRLAGQSLPATVLVAIEGKRIGDVVDDARLGPMRDLVITGASNGERSLVLEVADGRIALEGRKNG